MIDTILCESSETQRETQRERERERERERDYSLKVTPNCALFLVAGFRVMICGRAVESRQCSLWHLVLELPGCRLFSAIIFVGFRVERLHDSECRRVKIFLQSRIDS